ncbi:MAG: DUF3793 family protein [Selenomonas artemidis]
MRCPDFEHLLGYHAAPLLAGLTSGSLLSFQKSRFEDFEGLLASYEPCFSCKGISTFRVAEGTEYVLILFYRAELVERALTTSGAKEILAGAGYRDTDSMEDRLEFLRLRMRVRKTLPPEVGLFLGYPPEDVQAFIARRGQDFLYSGYWKVYTNEAEARALFERYSACTQEFCTRLEAGRPLAELVQAV